MFILYKKYLLRKNNNYYDESKFLSITCIFTSRLQSNIIFKPPQITSNKAFPYRIHTSCFPSIKAQIPHFPHKSTLYQRDQTTACNFQQTMNHTALQHAKTTTIPFGKWTCNNGESNFQFRSDVRFFFVLPASYLTRRPH